MRCIVGGRTQTRDTTFSLCTLYVQSETVRSRKEIMFQALLVPLSCVTLDSGGLVCLGARC